MYITVYVDPDDQSLHVFRAAERPSIPDDLLPGTRVLVFDTDKVAPAEPIVISKAQVLEAIGEDPEFGDDSVTAMFDPNRMDFGERLVAITEVIPE